MIVDIEAPFDSHANGQYLKALKDQYPFIDVLSAGKSVLGKDILYARLGTGKSPIFIVGAHHALEWITSLILLTFMEEFCCCAVRGAHLSDYDPRYLLETTNIYILPLLNCDGVDLVCHGAAGLPDCAQLLRYNKGEADFSTTWQANAHGVDLNHNYDALWDAAKKLEPVHNVSGPGPTRFGGPYPESEPEVQAVCRLVRSVPFRHVTAYHTQGEVIYWDFEGKAPRGALAMAQLLSKASGYAPSTTEGIASFGGMKDWVIKEFGIPAFTVEAGHGKNPLPLTQFREIYEKNRQLLLLLTVL